MVWSKDSEFKPFCSERCRLIDLGQWAAEEHRIPCIQQGAQQEIALGSDDLTSLEAIGAGEPNENLH